MAKISIEGMEFHAYHGCFMEEQIIGNTFIVDLYIETNTSSSEGSDNLAETINYAEVFDVVKDEMAKKSKLLEHLARRILDSVQSTFPKIESAAIKVSKLNPPVGGKVHSVSVSLESR